LFTDEDNTGKQRVNFSEQSQSRWVAVTEKCQHQFDMIMLPVVPLGQDCIWNCSNEWGSLLWDRLKAVRMQGINYQAA
jgi:hypothetical protein